MSLEQRPEILVVDHDPATRQFARLHLESAGYEVSLAANAIVAGCRLVHATPHLLVVAVEMPELGGLEFVSSLVADCSMPCVPVIFLASSSEFRARAAALGAAMLVKPLAAQPLVSLVQGLAPLNLSRFAPQRRRRAEPGAVFSRA